MADKVRVTRLIQYVGDRDWVEDQLRRSIQGSKVLPKGIITVATLDDFPGYLDTTTELSLCAAMEEVERLRHKVDALERQSAMRMENHQQRSQGSMPMGGEQIATLDTYGQGAKK